MNIIKKTSKHKLFVNGGLFVRDVNGKFKIINIEGSRINIDCKDDFVTFTESCNYVRSVKDSTGYVLKNNVLEKTNFKFHNVTNDSIAVGNVHNTYLHNNTLFKLPEGEQVLSAWLPNNIYHIQGQYWCNDTEEDFKLIDADKGEILWSIPQPEVERPYGYSGLTNIRKLLGIYNDCLWLQLPDSRVCGLDIHTGELKKEIKHEHFLVHEDTIWLDMSSGKIIVFCFDLYVCFDLNTLIFSADFILPDTIRITKSSIYSSTKLVFVGCTASREPNVYGIFDTTSCRFIFQGEQIDEDGFFYDTPQVNDELFTILDSKGNLIIHKMNDILPAL